MTILPISSSKNAVILSEIEGSVPRAFSSAISTFYLVARATSLPGSPQATGGDPSASPCLPSVFLLSTFHFSALPPPRPPCLRVNTVASATQSQGSSRAYSPGGQPIPSYFNFQRSVILSSVEGSVPPAFSSAISTFYFLLSTFYFLLSAFHFSALPPPRLRASA